MHNMLRGMYHGNFFLLIMPSCKSFNLYPRRPSQTTAKNKLESEYRIQTIEIVVHTWREQMCVKSFIG